MRDCIPQQIVTALTFKVVSWNVLPFYSRIRRQYLTGICVGSGAQREVFVQDRVPELTIDRVCSPRECLDLALGCFRSFQRLSQSDLQRLAGFLQLAAAVGGQYPQSPLARRDWRLTELSGSRRQRNSADRATLLWVHRHLPIRENCRFPAFRSRHQANRSCLKLAALHR